MFTVTGLYGLGSHLGKIALLWLAVFLINKLIANAAIKTRLEILRHGTIMEKQDGKSEQAIKGTSRIINIVTSCLASVFMVISVLFLYNPTEKNYEQMGKIAPAKTSTSFSGKTKKEIQISNKEVVEEKHKKKKESAIEDNNKALEETFKLFNVKERVK